MWYLARPVKRLRSLPQAANPNLVYVANQPPAPTAEALIVQKIPIQSVQDLKGKRIALNKGSNVHYLY